MTTGVSILPAPAQVQLGYDLLKVAFGPVITVSEVTPTRKFFGKWRVEGLDSSLVIQGQGIAILAMFQTAKIRAKNGISTINLQWGTSIDDVTYSSLTADSIGNASFVGVNTTQNPAVRLMDLGISFGFIALSAFVGAVGEVGEIKSLEARAYVHRPLGASIVRVI